MNLFKIDKDNKSNAIANYEESYSEQELEELLEKNPELLIGEKVVLIGRQVYTDTKKILDLLAIDKFGRIIVAELKKDFAPRDTIAQIIDYTAWLSKLSERELEKIAKDYFEKKSIPYRTMYQAFETEFNRKLSKAIGEDILSVLFARAFSQEVTKAAEYLNEKGVPIKCTKFDIFISKSGERYFVTQNIVGDDPIEYVDKHEDKEVAVSVATKGTFRQIINKLSKFLEDNYGSWSTSLGSERLKPFGIFQTRQGTWTSAVVDWLFKDETNFVLELGIYRESDGESQGFRIDIFTRTRSSTMYNLINSRNDLMELLSDFVNESRVDKIRFTKSTKLDNIDYATVEKIAVEEIKRIRPLIEAVLL